MTLDIFSKSNKEQEKIEIAVDFRERNSLVPSELINLDCALKYAQLEVGDYISGKYIVERKTLADLQSSVIDKRIFSQIEKLKSQENSILIIEGEQGWKIHENAYRGLILHILESKIPIIFSKNEKETAKYLIVMQKNKPKSQISFRPYKKIDSKLDIQKYILEGFPGIGPKTSEKLLERFKSIKEIINAPENQLKEILGSKYELFSKYVN